MSLCSSPLAPNRSQQPSKWKLHLRAIPILPPTNVCQCTSTTIKPNAVAKPMTQEYGYDREPSIAFSDSNSQRSLASAGTYDVNMDDEGSSLSSSASWFSYAEGRRFHNSEHDIAYYYPNDAEELDRLDCQHEGYKLLLGGRNYPIEVLSLHLDPKDPVPGPRTILDLGTGSGVWAIQMGDEFPNSTVIGVDLAPVQPERVPPNVTFVCEDFTKVDDLDYSYILRKREDRIGEGEKRKFELIFMRCLIWGIRDWEAIIEQIAQGLEEGGMMVLIEPGEMPFSVFEGEGSVGEATLLWWRTLRECMAARGAHPDAPAHLAEMVERNPKLHLILAKRLDCPIGDWASDEDLKVAGRYLLRDCLLALETTKPLFLLFGYSEGWIQALHKNCRIEWADSRRRAWIPSRMVVARRKKAS
ncbi:S-adenosyl-L-methionine-dependent methyltransferase [Atractiella rhizophila]|nr:S-adenosyl-L-methionine-dependent methyltransferase [Atractiella rhizophila]